MLTVGLPVDVGVARRAGQVEYDELSVMRPRYDHFVQLDRRVHASHRALVTDTNNTRQSILPSQL